MPTPAAAPDDRPEWEDELGAAVGLVDSSVSDIPADVSVVEGIYT
jgi:hypothetical protein